jgi:hypothetical protein
MTTASISLLCWLYQVITEYINQKMHIGNDGDKANVYILMGCFKMKQLFFYFF